MTNHTAMGIIFPNMHDQNLMELTDKRTMASVPFGGRYRLIDFGLSAMANAGISNIGVIVKQNYQSLMDHLGNGREWDLSRKRGGLVIFPPYGDAGGRVYHGRIEALAQIMDYIGHQREKYVIMMDCDAVCNVDFSALLSAHAESGADVTIVYDKGPLLAGITKNNMTLTLDEAGRVRAMRSNDCACGDGQISLDIFVMEREKLMEQVRQAISCGKTMFERDVLSANLDTLRVMGYEYTGYRARIYDMASYYRANMEMLNRENLKRLFSQGGTIYTKVRDEAPVRYVLGSGVHSSIVADGCIIEGRVENCVLFRDVHVGKGALLKNCILMQGTVIEPGVEMRYCVTDKDVTVTYGKVMVGYETYPVYIAKGAKV